MENSESNTFESGGDTSVTEAVENVAAPDDAEARLASALAENESLRAEMNARELHHKAEKDVRAWTEQAEQARAAFPDLDLREEMKNPKFVSLLKADVDVSTAYFALHRAEILPQIAEYAAKRVQSRPAENGVSAHSSARISSDVSTFSKEQREAIARRVARGERIIF